MCSCSDAADGMGGVSRESLAKWPTEKIASIDATDARVCGQFDSVFSFGDLEELAENDGFGSDAANTRVIPSSDLEEQSRSFSELAERGNVEFGNGDALGGGNMYRVFTFGSLEEQAEWPSQPADIDGDACVQGSVLGSSACGSGARAAWKFRDRALEEDACRRSCMSSVQSATPSPWTSVYGTTEMVDAQQSVKPPLESATVLAVEVPERRSIKPEPRVRPGASSGSCTPRRRSVKPTPRKRTADASSQTIEVADAEMATCAVVGQAEEAPTRDGTFETQASDSRPSF
eukprot:TRINITY_DN13617_c1_g1_i3.p1 TRINITY_DN13617_c1_g1~~TRINITY_DN13617_c1_g1_i3.p1  ORF type:complete len:289 (-),score=38.37 TRINITY_DN13617_c1_g1_i3:306-1172(-)